MSSAFGSVLRQSAPCVIEAVVDRLVVAHSSMTCQPGDRRGGAARCESWLRSQAALPVLPSWRRHSANLFRGVGR